MFAPGQGQPEDSAQRHPAMVPRRRKTPSRLCPHDRQAHQRQAADRARTLGTARNLDHHRAQRLSPVPRRGQAFLIRRTRCQVRKGRVTDTSVDTSWGVTSHTPHTADAQRLLRINRGHWTIENSLHRILDDSDNWNEDNSRIRTGHGPENMTGLRRFAIGVIKMHGKPVAMRRHRAQAAPHPTPAARLSEDERQHSAQARHRLTPTPRRTTTIQTQPARKASALREPSPVPGTPRHKPENPRKPRAHTSAPDTISRHPRSRRTPVPCHAPLRHHPQQNKNLPCSQARAISRYGVRTDIDAPAVRRSD